MAKITFVQFDGETQIVDVKAGLSVMEGAVINSVPRIDADCGGGCACATCHVYLDADWLEKAGQPSLAEEAMLEMAHEVRPNSRLSCQIKVTDHLDGMVVHVPESQH